MGVHEREIETGDFSAALGRISAQVSTIGQALGNDEGGGDYQPEHLFGLGTLLDDLSGDLITIRDTLYCAENCLWDRANAQKRKDAAEQRRR